MKIMASLLQVSHSKLTQGSGAKRTPQANWLAKAASLESFLCRRVWE